MILSTPEPLAARHQLLAFDCGVDELNDWLARRALSNQREGAARTYVVLDESNVIGYHALASGAIVTNEAPGRFRRNMPNTIPVAILGRLAVAKSHHGQGLGHALFRDSAKRVLHAADEIGIRGMIVHALSTDARAFYLALGFQPSPVKPMTLLVTLNDLCAALRVANSGPPGGFSRPIPPSRQQQIRGLTAAITA